MLTRSHRFLLLLIPSSASGLGCLTLAALVVMVNYLKSSSGDSAINDGIAGFQVVFNPAYHRLTDGLAQNSLASNLPLLLFWSAIGAFVYVIAVRLVTVFSNTAKFQQSLLYANLERSNVLAVLAINFVVRLAAIFGWFAYCALFFKTLLPYAVNASQQVSSGTVVSHVGTLLGAVVLLAIALQIHVIFIRLIMLRLRIFSSTV